MRFDQDTVPASLFKMPSLRAIGWMVGADLDKKAGGFALEKIADELLLLLLRWMKSHNRPLRR